MGITFLFQNVSLFVTATKSRAIIAASAVQQHAFCKFLCRDRQNDKVENEGFYYIHYIDVLPQKGNTSGKRSMFAAVFVFLPQLVPRNAFLVHAQEPTHSFSSHRYE